MGPRPEICVKLSRSHRWMGSLANRAGTFTEFWVLVNLVMLSVNVPPEDSAAAGNLKSRYTAAFGFVRNARASAVMVWAPSTTWSRLAVTVLLARVNSVQTADTPLL